MLGSTGPLASSPGVKAWGRGYWPTPPCEWPDVLLLWEGPGVGEYYIISISVEAEIGRASCDFHAEGGELLIEPGFI